MPMPFRRLSAFVALAWVVAVPVWAQEEPPPMPGDRPTMIDNPVSPIKAEVAGYLRHALQKSAVGGVLIRLETNTGSLVAQAWTNGSGHFVFPTIGCGYYVLAVDVTGYKPIRVEVEHSYVSTETMLYLQPDENQNLAVAASSPRPIPSAARKEFDKGMAALAKRQREKGIMRLRKAIELYPEFDEAYVQLSLAYVEQGAYPDAQEVLEKAVAVHANNGRAHALLGVVQREQQRLPEAAAALRRSLSLNEKSWFAQLELGETLVRMGKPEEAWLHVARAHELNPNTPPVHLLLYKTLILRSEYEKALAELDEFLKLFPEHVLAPRAREKRAALQKTVSPTAN